jgi:hypothetical protein
MDPPDSATVTTVSPIPLLAVALIVADPTAFAVSLPVASTSTIVGADDDHSMLCGVAIPDTGNASSCSVMPVRIVGAAGET